MMLADQGADVIKIETPWGDDARNLIIRPHVETESRSFWVMNRNKRSLVLDLKKPEGLEVFKRLVAGADVVLHNFRPGVDEKLGIGYESLRSINPRIIFVAFSPYGSKGPGRGRRGYDGLIQAASGILGRRKLENGLPRSLGVWAVDTASAPILAYAITLALLERERTGVGTQIEGSLLQTALLLQGVEMVKLKGENPESGINYGGHSLSSAYECSDGRHIQVAAVQDAEWENLCRALGQDHLMEDPDFVTSLERRVNTDRLRKLLEEVFITQSSDHWEEKFVTHDVGAMRVLTPEEVFDSPQVVANEMFTEVEIPGSGTALMANRPFRFSGKNGKPIKASPKLGEHTTEILGEIGFSQEEIEGLKAARVVIQGSE